MSIELTGDARSEAIASIQRYAEESLEESIGNIAAGALLDFFLEEIGPSIFNQAVREVQERMHARVAEIDLDVNQVEFAYWRRLERERRNK
ncbi:MAG: DUF2164 domain-containing protein [Rhodothermales bacterium]|nr:DUF2164 domain-containing protein [Rhodothermales bacterium]